MIRVPARRLDRDEVDTRPSPQKDIDHPDDGKGEIERSRNADGQASGSPLLRSQQGKTIAITALITAVLTVIVVVVVTSSTSSETEAQPTPSASTTNSSPPPVVSSSNPASSSASPASRSSAPTGPADSSPVLYREQDYVVPAVPNCEGVGIDFDERKVSPFFHGSTADDNKKAAGTAEMLRFGDCGAPFGPSAHWEITERHTLAEYAGSTPPRRDQCETALNQSPLSNRLADDEFNDMTFVCFKTDQSTDSGTRTGYLRIKGPGDALNVAATIWS
jgi:hypothetical protein